MVRWLWPRACWETFILCAPLRYAHAFGRSVLFIFSNLAAQSGRTMARTGLRMMPTFPSSSLKFRTAGFPQYGFKAGLQVGPSSPDTTSRIHPVCFHLSCLLLSALLSALCRRCWYGQAPPCERPSPLYPRGPRSGSGYSVPIPLCLFDPIRPTGKHIAISLLRNLYAMPSLCVAA